MRGQKRRRLNAMLRNTGNMPAKRRASREVLRDVEELQTLWSRIRNCSPYRPCNQAYCEACSATKAKYRKSAPVSSKGGRTVRKGIGRGGDRNFRARGGGWLAEPFRNQPLDTVFPFTINLAMIPLNSSGTEMAKKIRGRLSRLAKRELPDIVARFQFDVVAKPVTAVAPELLGDEWGNPPNAPVGLMFHAHGFIHHPFLRASDIAKVLRKSFPGPKQVCVSRHIPISVDDQGQETGGLVGYGEYASMEKTELNFPDADPEFDNVSVFEALAKFRQNWPRQSRRWTFGYRRQNSSTEQNQSLQTKDANSIPCDNYRVQARRVSEPQGRALSSRILVLLWGNCVLVLECTNPSKTWCLSMLVRCYLNENRHSLKPP